MGDFASALETFGRFKQAYDANDFALSLSLLSKLKVEIVRVKVVEVEGEMTEEKGREFVFCSKYFTLKQFDFFQIFCDLFNLHISSVHIFILNFTCGPTGHVLELGAMLSVKMKDMKAFERHVAQLRPYYAVQRG